MRCSALGLLLVAAFGCSFPEPREISQTPRPSSALQTIVTINDPELDELSGLAASRRNQGIFWAHNDSGDSARLFAVNVATGSTVAELHLQGAHAFDWEDISIGPGADGRSTIFVGDVGDNLHIRPGVTIYRLVEPVVEVTEGEPKQLSANADVLDFSYPEGHPNCEAILRDPLSNRLVLITKNPTGDAEIFSGDALAPSETEAELSKVGTVRFEMGSATRDAMSVTGAAISFDGMRIALRTNAVVAEWTRDRAESIEAALGRPPVRTIAAMDDESEAIAYGQDAALYVSREAIHPPIQRIEAVNLAGLFPGAAGSMR